MHAIQPIRPKGHGTDRPAIRNPSGYTYIEIVVALAILAVAMAGIYRVMIVSMETRQVSQNHYVGTIMANNQIERAKNLMFGDLTSLAEVARPVDELGASDSEGRYRRTTLIEPSWGGQSNLTRITVTVLPPAPNRSAASGADPVSVSTILYPYLDP